MILVPVKEMSTAKQRLASVLTQEQRTALARTMLKDICAALAEVKPRPVIALVSNDAFAAGLARHYGFDIIVDNDNLGESDAIAMATVEAQRRGAEFTMVLPGDIPLLRASEVEAVLAKMPEQGSVLVPAADGRGTNAVLRRP
ncbi:MAG: 2-phospho-L-lactate guanylyltransferase, partial [Terriglobales bacterium]